MSNKNLIKLASKFRSAIESCSPASLPITFSNFPHGSCGDACLLLGAWLHDHNENEFLYVCGQRKSQSHAWLQRKEIIVDITGDQFEEVKKTIYVGTKNSFYDAFIIEYENQSDFRNYGDQNTLGRLGIAYSVIKQHMT